MVGDSVGEIVMFKYWYLEPTHTIGSNKILTTNTHLASLAAANVASVISRIWYWLISYMMNSLASFSAAISVKGSIS